MTGGKYMELTHVWAICKKQNKDTMKNKAVFMQFIIFPVMAFVLEYAVEIPGMPENYFMNLFAVMFLGMAPMTAMATLLSEEKEKNTLRMLKLAGTTSVEYMLGAGGYLFLVCMIFALVFAGIGALQGGILLVFLAVMAAGIIISLLIGAVIGIRSKNQAAATSVAVPVMMIFSFLPMISMFNETVRKIGRFTYTGQIQGLLSQLSEQAIGGETAAVLAGNLLVAVFLFGIVYKKCGL